MGGNSFSNICKVCETYKSQIKKIRVYNLELGRVVKENPRLLEKTPKAFELFTHFFLESSKSDCQQLITQCEQIIEESNDPNLKSNLQIII